MEEDDEPLSEQLPLPEIDMSTKARFQRSRERRIGLVLALIEKVLLKETENGLHPEDMAEAARRLPSIVEKIANKRASMLNVEKSIGKRHKTAEKKWTHAEDLAKQIRAKDPKKSQEKVAEEIQLLWELPLGDLPGYRTLVRFISKLEEDGRLPAMWPTRPQPHRVPKPRKPKDPLDRHWLGAFETAHAVDEPDKFLFAFGRGADDHQQALRGLLERGLHMDAVDPEVNVAFGREIALAPMRMLVRPGLLEPPDGRCREPAGILAKQCDQRLLEITGGDALQVENRDQHL